MDMIFDFAVLICVLGRISGELTTQPPDRRKLCTDEKSQCVLPGSTDVCSGRGDCVCGNCHCYSSRGDLPLTYTGTWCECDPSSCPSFNGLVCGGSDHGICDCGFCKCYKNFDGKNCGCSTKKDMCTANDGTVCGGHGECMCNKCKCDKDYAGEKCTECKNCRHTCDANKECVKCMLARSDNSKGETSCKQQCSQINVNFVDDVEKTDLKNTDSEILCEYEGITYIVQTDKIKRIQIKAASRIEENPKSSGVRYSSMVVVPLLAVLKWVFQ
ncbi:integrin beta-1-B-like [Mytilus galloprovincialis]|uniref:integrin beta-1-B-like n=1 Tax=Mytilus galloprovincialis TaxID=29158 RepID=UPI003F7BD5BF